MQGKRVRLNGDGSVGIESYDVPAPAPDQVLVRVSVTQVSAGSEVNGIRARRSGNPGNFPSAGLGYTAIGRVAAVGAAVKGWEVGERVLCGGNHASHWLVTPRLGESPESIPQQYMLERIPDTLDDVSAAFCILGDIALHGVRRAQIELGDSVAVHGLGVIGLISAQLARLSGAHPVIGVDKVAARLELARTLGVSHVVDLRHEEAVDAIRTITANPWRFRGALPGLAADGGADVQLHCTSYIGNYPTLLKAAADRGRIVLVGATAGSVAIESHELLRRELKIMGSYETGLIDPHPYWRWSRARNRALIWDLIGRGQLAVKPLVSHVAHYSDAPDLYEQMAQGGEGWLGVHFTWDEL
jgi:threonine dehydrogenase-like Zn-dependent dehydrogenase